MEEEAFSVYGFGGDVPAWCAVRLLIVNVTIKLFHMPKSMHLQCVEKSLCTRWKFNAECVVLSLNILDFIWFLKYRKKRLFFKRFVCKCINKLSNFSKYITVCKIVFETF